MRRIIVGWCALAAITLGMGSCGGGGGSGTTDYSRIATATAPASMPDPIFPSGKSVALAGGLRYTVQSGDSPSSIASKFGISADELMAANDISDPTKLHVGQVLVIPGAATLGPRAATATPSPVRRNGTPSPTPRAGSTPTPTEPEGGGRRRAGANEQTYIVQSGDNASSIAASFGISVEELAQLNGTTVDALRQLSVGGELIVPAGQPVPSPTSPPPESSPTVPPAAPSPTGAPALPPTEAPAPTAGQ